MLNETVSQHIPHPYILNTHSKVHSWSTRIAIDSDKRWFDREHKTRATLLESFASGHGKLYSAAAKYRRNRFARAKAYHERGGGLHGLHIDGRYFSFI